jgi:ABC-2 type transport system permease protein
MNGFSPFLGLYRKTVYHYFLPPRWKTYIPFLALVSIGFGLLTLEYLGFRKVFHYMNSLEDFPLFFIQALLERFVGLVFLISYSMIFMSSMINGLSSFYLSQNLPFLYSLPVPRWRVLAVKYLETWSTSCYLVLLFLACFLFAYARSFHLGWSHYVNSVLLLILFTASPVALGVASLSVLIRFFPVRRIHQVVSLFAGVFLGALVIAVRMMKPERLLSPSNTDDFVRLIKDLTVPSLNHLPSSWAAHIVVYGAGPHILLLLATAAGSIALLAVVLRAIYDKAFIYSSESRSLKGKPRAMRRSPRKSRGAVASLIIKDLRLFMRDATQWSQLLLLAALVIVYLLNIKNLAIQLPMVRWVVSFINLGLAGFVLAALSVRFLFPSVSMEGRSFWIIRTIPISFRTLLWCKYVIYFPPFLLFAQVLVYFSNRILAVPAFFIVLSTLNILGVAFALTGLAIGIGALMPDFRTDHPSQIAVGPGGVLYMLLSFVYLGAMLMIQLRPVWFYVINSSDRIHGALYAVGAVVLTLSVGLIPMELGARRLAKQEH